MVSDAYCINQYEAHVRAIIGVRFSSAMRRRIRFTGTVNLMVREGMSRSDVISLASRAVEDGNTGVSWYGRADVSVSPGAHLGFIITSAPDKTAVMIRLKELGLEVNAPHPAENVAIIIESADDVGLLKDALLFFDKFSVTYSIAVMSHQYSIARINLFASEIVERGSAVIIAVSSRSYQLASLISSLCVLPVIALCVPKENSVVLCKPDDASFSIVASTRGVDAALLAIKVLSTSSGFEHFQGMLLAHFQEKELELVRETFTLNEMR